MSKSNLLLTGREVTFGDDEVIVSKTDKTGRITYANHVFMRVAGYTEQELLRQPHSIIRHPHMPRAAFKLVWDTLAQGKEIFAYVLNRCKNGDHYWVFAHATPDYDPQGNVIGYHSSRRKPERSAIEKIAPVYQLLLDIENKEPDRKVGMQKSFQAVLDLLQNNGVSYEEFVFSL